MRNDQDDYIMAADIPLPATPMEESDKTSIGMLPEEVFEEVVELVVDRHLVDYQTTHLQPLRLVSHRWRQAIDSFPRLWANIRSSYTPLWTSLSLEKSQIRPLTVWWDIPEDELLSRRSRTVVELAEPHITRWVKLAVQFHGNESSIDYVNVAKLRSFNIPNLTGLILTGRVRDKARWDTFGGHPSALETIFIRRYTIPWDSTILLSGKLRSLNLLKINHNGPTVDEVLHILTHCRNLRSLHLGGSGFMLLDEPEHPSMDVVSLPKVKEFTLKMSGRPLVRLFQRLDIPACKQLSIHFVTLTQYEAECLRKMLDLLQPRIAALPMKCSRLTVQARVGQVGILSDSGFLNLLIPSTINGFRQVVVIFAAFFPLDQLQEPLPGAQPEVIIDWRPRYYWNDSAMLPSQPAFNSRVSVIKISAEDSTSQILQFLSTPREPDAQWAYPNLKHLEVEYEPEGVKDVVAFVTARCGDRGAREGNASDVLHVYLVAAATKSGELQEPCEEVNELGRKYPQVSLKSWHDSLDDAA